MSCASGQEQSGALCYPPCKSGYDGVGPLCWSRCSGETTDTGADCLRKNYGRGVGKLPNCFFLSQDSLQKANISNITSLVKRGKVQDITVATCYALWTASRETMEYLSGFTQCISTWNTLVFSISSSESGFISSGTVIGIAVDFEKNKAACYKQACTGLNFDPSVGIAVHYGWFRSLEDIRGRESVVFVAADIPETSIGVSFASVINSDNEYVGTLGAVGLGAGSSPLPFDVGGATCNTPNDKFIEFTP